MSVGDNCLLYIYPHMHRVFKKTSPNGKVHLDKLVYMFSSLFTCVNACLHVVQHIDACLHVVQHIDACLHVVQHIDACLHVFQLVYRSSYSLFTCLLFQITVYVGKRDFVDHVTKVDPIGKPQN